MRLFPLLVTGVFFIALPCQGDPLAAQMERGSSIHYVRTAQINVGYDRPTTVSPFPLYWNGEQPQDSLVERVATAVAFVFGWLERLDAGPFAGVGASFQIRGQAPIYFDGRVMFRYALDADSVANSATTSRIRMYSVTPALMLDLGPLALGGGPAYHVFNGDFASFGKWSATGQVVLEIATRLHLGTAINVFDQFDSARFSPLVVNFPATRREAVFEIFGVVFLKR